MLPVLARRVFYPLHERLCGRRTFPLYRELIRSQWLSPGDLRALQTLRLNALLAHALEHSPWHARRLREAGLEAAVRARSCTLEDLARLPPMTREDAQRHREEIVWREIPGGAQRYNTGGSSGEPLIFYFGRDRQAADAAARLRAREWWGIAPGDKEAYLWGAPVELSRQDRAKRWRDALVNHRIFNAFDMSAATMDAYLEALSRWRPASLYGYASSVALLAAHVEARRKSSAPALPSLRVVCTTGEPLYPHQRALIEAAFGVPVANEFGSRDAGFLAHEAPGGALLQTAEQQILEVLDENGRPCPPGTPGEVVVTGLASYAQAFIRYRTGDVVTLAEQRDPQGRGLPVLAAVAGRQTDFVVREDGSVMHALAVIYVLRAVEGVRQFKCEQLSTTEFHVSVVPGPAWNATARQAVIDGLRERLGQTTRIALEEVAEIPASRSGKHRYVVSHVKLPAELDATGEQDAAAGAARHASIR